MGREPRITEAVDHPAHYGGADNPYESIKVIEAWDLGFCLGKAVKYISRAGKKDPKKTFEDLKKARWYLDREIAKHGIDKPALIEGHPSTVEPLIKPWPWAPGAANGHVRDEEESVRGGGK